MLHLFDTATAQVVPLAPAVDGKLSIYLCGPTVYSDPHIGHGRLTLVWDILRRYATWAGSEVHFVSNVTDIDDKIIARAAEEGCSADAIAKRYEARWWKTMDRIGVIRPDQTPHATDWVPQMIALIGELVADGHAYVGGDGVYFSAGTVDDYGLLARQPLESLRAGARLAPDAGAAKRAPIDFVLWKNAKPGEPSWESPWGQGRPGWHTECVAMSLALLGDRFDLHGGGLDLAFPHHENERAQAVAAGHAFARRWVHSGMLVTEGGEKMSKSLGNGVSLPELLENNDHRVLRLLVLQSHYRSPMTIGSTSIGAANETLRGLDAFARQHAGDLDAKADEAAVVRFQERMDADLDTPGAVADLFDLRRSANTAGPNRAAVLAATVVGLFAAVGLPLGDTGEVAIEVPAAIRALAARRDEARSAKDWADADRIRNQLAEEGWVIEDSAGGTTIRRSGRTGAAQ